MKNLYHKLFKQKHFLNSPLKNLYVCFQMQMGIVFIGPTRYLLNLLNTTIHNMLPLIEQSLANPIPKIQPGKKTLLIMNHVGELDNIVIFYFIYKSLGLNINNFISVSSEENFLDKMEKKFNICLATKKKIKFKKKYNKNSPDVITIFPEKFFYMPNPIHPHTNTPLMGALKDVIDYFQPDKIIDITLLYTQLGFRRTVDSLDCFDKGDLKIWSQIKIHDKKFYQNLEKSLRDSFIVKNEFIEDILSHKMYLNN